MIDLRHYLPAVGGGAENLEIPWPAAPCQAPASGH
jgi:hypothetical protein